ARRNGGGRVLVEPGRRRGPPEGDPPARRAAHRLRPRRRGGGTAQAPGRGASRSRLPPWGTALRPGRPRRGRALVAPRRGAGRRGRGPRLRGLLRRAGGRDKDGTVVPQVSRGGPPDSGSQPRRPPRPEGRSGRRRVLAGR